MIIFLAIFAVIFLISCRATSIKEFNTGYMSKDNTNIIKGVFVVFVFFSHCSQYLVLNGKLDTSYLAVRDYMGQMIVAMFLFYSGYGIMESIRKKSFGYVKKIPLRRVLKTLINFDIIVILYLVIDIIIKAHYKLSDILLSFVAWTSIGNSNWYILAILILYVLAFFAFLPIMFSNKKYMHIICAIILTILTVIAAFVLFKIGRESYYYNTLLIFPLGVWFSILKPYIDKFVMRNHLIYFIVLAVGLFAFIFSHIHMNDQPYLVNATNYTLSIPYTIWSFAFTLFIVLLTMKIRIKSFIFTWLGEHIFTVYMLQRVPMLILKQLGIDEYKYLFVIISLVVSIPLAIAFDMLFKKMWSKINI